MSFLKCCSSGCTGRGSEGSGFTKSISLKLPTLTKGVSMTLHKSMWKAAVLMGIAGVLLFAGGAMAAVTPNGAGVVIRCVDTAYVTWGDSLGHLTGPAADTGTAKTTNTRGRFLTKGCAAFDSLTVGGRTTFIYTGTEATVPTGVSKDSTGLLYNGDSLGMSKATRVSRDSGVVKIGPSTLKLVRFANADTGKRWFPAFSGSAALNTAAIAAGAATANSASVLYTQNFNLTYRGGDSLGRFATGNADTVTYREKTQSVSIKVTKRTIAAAEYTYWFDTGAVKLYIDTVLSVLEGSTRMSQDVYSRIIRNKFKVAPNENAQAGFGEFGFAFRRAEAVSAPLAAPTWNNFIKSDGTFANGKDTLPKAPGKYVISLIMKPGPGVNAIDSGAIVFDKDTLVVKDLQYTSGVVLGGNATYPYDPATVSTQQTNRTGVKIPVPTFPTALGVIDSVKYFIVGAAGSTNLPNLKGQSPDKPDTLTLRYQDTCVLLYGDTGTVKIGMKAKGRTGATGTSPRNGWTQSDSTQVEIKITPRDIAKVSVSYSGFDLMYKGDSLYPRSAIVAVDGAVSLKLGAGKDDAAAQFYYDTTEAWRSQLLNRNAGPAKVRVIGRGIYTGETELSFNIAKKKIAVVIDTITPRIYNGSASLDTSAIVGTEDSSGRVSVKFYGVYGADPVKDTLRNVGDYVISGASLNNKSAGIGRTATVTVRLTDDGEVSKNYALVPDTTLATAVAGPVTLTRTGVTVLKLKPKNAASTEWKGDSAVFSYTIPKNHFFNNRKQGIGAANIALKSGLEVVTGGAASGNSFKVLYTYGVDQKYYVNDVETGRVFEAETDTTFTPKDSGDYKVKVRVPLVANANIDSGTYIIGQYTIQPPARPDLTDGDLDPTYQVRQGMSLTLRVTAKLPEGAAGTLSYRWLECADPACASSSPAVGTNNTSSYLVPSGNMGTYYYRVDVTNTQTPGNFQSKTESTVAAVTVTDPPKNMSNATIVVPEDAKFIYSGTPIRPNNADDGITVRLPDADAALGYVELIEGTDYALTYEKNVDVGTATIIATHVEGGDYRGRVTATFAIGKKELNAFDLIMKETRDWTGDTLNADVKLRPGLTGAGAITVKYNGAATLPKAVNVYTVTASVADGPNLIGTAGKPDFWIGVFEVEKATPPVSWFSGYTIPTNHKEDQTGPFGITGTVVMKNSAGVTFNVEYEGIGSTYYGPSDEPPYVTGTYAVYANITEGGDNVKVCRVKLGDYNIGVVSVAQGNREVPKTDVTEVVTIAPLPVKPAAPFTAGPSPVKLGGEIKFFSKSVKSAIYIFDASGSNVAKLSAKPGKDGAVAVWNLKDKKGASVSEGTYVAVAKDGRDKVSFRFSVVK